MLHFTNLFVISKLILSNLIFSAFALWCLSFQVDILIIQVYTVHFILIYDNLIKYSDFYKAFQRCYFI